MAWKLYEQYWEWFVCCSYSSSEDVNADVGLDDDDDVDDVDDERYDVQIEPSREEW